jgi:hypothetical protein
MFRHIIIIIILITSQFAFLTNAQAAESILLPFSYTEVWNTDVINGRDDYGVHKDRLGVALDLYTDQSALVLAPISGNLEQGCTSQGVTLVSITNSAGLQIRLIHLLENTLRQSSGYIKQGSPIAMTAPKGEYNSPGCNVASDGYHVHFSITTNDKSNCGYNIDGYNIQCSGMRQCDNSQDGSYKLSFGVECNRKYINRKFVSTNGFPLNNSQCDALIKDANGVMPKDETNLLNLQVCLTQANLYLGVYTRQWDDNTRALVSQYLNIPAPGPSKAELDAKAEAIKNAEAARLAEESRIAQEAQKAEDARLKEEYRLGKEKEAKQLQIQKLDEERVLEERKKKSDFENNINDFMYKQNNNRNIILILTTLFMIGSTLLLLLVTQNKKKKNELAIKK